MWLRILLLFFVFSFLYRTDYSFDQDLGRHLRLGEIITQTHQVPKINLFSYTNPDFPFINTHWLFEVFVYVWSQTLRLQSLLILKIIIFIFSVWLIFKTIPKENGVLFLPIGFIFLHVLRERLEFRPEIFSFLFTASTYYILNTSLRTKRGNLLFILPLIQLIWINTHIYFFVGLILQAIFLIHLSFHPRGGKLKLLTIISILSVIASLLNPNGIKGLLYPLNVNANYGYTIVENQTMFLLESINFRDPNFLFVKLSATIVAITIFVSFIKKQVDLKNLLLLLSGFGLALFNVRGFPYLVFLSLPAVLGNFSLGVLSNTPPMWSKLVNLFFGVLLILESFFYLNGDYYKYTESQHQAGLQFAQSSYGALDFVLANNLPLPIFNNFDIGSYIIYRGYPKYMVFVDGRPEAYPKEFFLNTYIPIQYDFNKFKEMDKQIGFKTIIFSHSDQTPWGKAFLQNVVKDPDWRIVFIDDFMIVLTTSDVVNEKKLSTINLSQLNPESYNSDNHLSYLRLGLFLLSTQNIESGKKFIEKTLQLFPNDPIANALIGQSPKNNFFW